MPVPTGSISGYAPAAQDVPSISDAIRSLVSMTESKCSQNQADSGDGAGSEVVMVDAEVDGERYLLVRMPKLGHNCFQLSPREHEIVRMVAKGHPNKVIADVLNISPWTVCTHLRRIFAKIGVGSRAAMVARFAGIGNSLTDAKSPAGMKQRYEAQSSCSSGVPATAPAGSRLTSLL
jgi:DNA-binding CsgD family transcriptional regulator